MKTSSCQIIAMLLSLHLIGGVWEVNYTKEGKEYKDQIRKPLIIIDSSIDYNNESYDELAKIIYLSPIRVTDLWK